MQSLIPIPLSIPSWPWLPNALAENGFPTRQFGGTYNYLRHPAVVALNQEILQQFPRLAFEPLCGTIASSPEKPTFSYDARLPAQQSVFIFRHQADSASCVSVQVCIPQRDLEYEIVLYDLGMLRTYQRCEEVCIHAGQHKIAQVLAFTRLTLERFSPAG